MHLTVFADFRCARAADGSVCTHNGGRRYAFWSRYLDVFEHVTVVARVSDRVSEGYTVTGPGVLVHAIPDYHGASQYLWRYPSVLDGIESACSADSAFILRVPGRLGTLAGRTLRNAGKPYALEVIGSPRDVFARGAVRHPLRPLLRAFFTADLQRLARGASAAAYVTEHALQQVYPCAGYEVGVSDVELGPEAFADDWKRAEPACRSFRIVTVGSLAQLYKGSDVLLHAIRQCIERGLDITLVLVGDGRFRPGLEALTTGLQLNDRVIFRGRLPAGPAVRAELDAADLFVLPSRADGLPRALLEAMARGLPCVASSIGGIPELLPADVLVKPGDVNGLAKRLEQLLTDPARRNDVAARCFARARDYREDALLAARREFYHEVVQRTRPALMLPQLAR